MEHICHHQPNSILIVWLLILLALVIDSNPLHYVEPCFAALPKRLKAAAQSCAKTCFGLFWFFGET
jgi:hypothetical protein